MNDDSFGGGFGDDEDEVIDAKDLSDDDDLDEDDDIDDDDVDEDEPQRGKRGKAPANPFNADDLASAITRGIQPIIDKQGQKQLTREEIEQQLGKPQVTVDLIKMLRDPETPPEKAHEALAQLMNQQAEYLLKASGLAIEGEVGKLNPRLEQVQQMIQSQNEERFAMSVARKFPALRGRENVVKQAMRYLQQQGYRPASPSDALRTVGRTARDIIRQIDPNFSLKGKQGQSFAAPRAGGGGRSSGGQQGRRGSGGLMSTVFPVG